MSKAILVIDMPKSCMKCEIFDHEQLLCLGGKVHFKNIDKVQSWCPLKPLPEKSCYYNPFDSDVGNVKVNNAFIDGWNACVDEILSLGEE